MKKGSTHTPSFTTQEDMRIKIIKKALRHAATYILVSVAYSRRYLWEVIAL